MFFARKYLDKLPKPPSVTDDELARLSKEMSTHPLMKGRSAEVMFQQLKAGAESVYCPKLPHISEKNGFTLKVVESLVPRSKQPLIEKDHAFLGDTYQKWLENDINDFDSGEYKIYDSRFMF